MTLAGLDKGTLRVLSGAGPYPLEAFAFVQEGLGFTMRRVHGDGEATRSDPRHTGWVPASARDAGGSGGGAPAAPAETRPPAGGAPGAGRRHVNGQQLCLGLREFAIDRFGLLAPVVLAHWNIHRTDDLGRMVFAMIRAELMSRTNEDSIDDFRSVYDFEEVFCHGALLAGIGVRGCAPGAAAGHDG